MVVLSNSLDSSAAVTAAATATNPEVKAFAELMVREHGQANVTALEIVRRLDTTPAVPGDTSNLMRAEPDSGLAALSQKTGADFDRAYIDAEVRLHQEALRRLDSEIIPSIQNVELKRLLETSREMVSAHLERARQIQSSLSR